jgi:hypothetical protein
MLNFDQMPKFKPHAYEIIKLVPAWALAYQVDEAAIIRQIPEAHAWILCNKAKAPKVRVTRFLHTWMRKAKQYGNLTIQAPGQKYVEEKPAEDEVMSGEDFRRMRETISGQNPQVVDKIPAGTKAEDDFDLF